MNVRLFDVSVNHRFAQEERSVFSILGGVYADSFSLVVTDEEIARRAATNTGSRSTLDGAQAGVAERHRVDPRVDGPLRSEGGVTGQFREGHEHEQKEHKKPGLIDKLLGRDLEPLERESR